MYLEKSEEKFAVLYTIDRYEAPLDLTTLFEIMTWEKQVMEYFDLSEILFELKEDKYIEKKYYRDLQAYILTDKGREALALFSERIPPAVKLKLNDAIGKIKFDRIADPNAVTAEVLPSGPTGWILRCSLKENGKEQMELVLNFHSSRLPAELSADNFKNNANKIYQGILKLCLPD